MREIGKLRDQVNAEFANQIFMGVILKNEKYENGQISYSQQYEDKVTTEIERLLSNLFNKFKEDNKKIYNWQEEQAKQSKDKQDLTKMFDKNLYQFLLYIKIDLAPKIKQLE